jgi:copper chaperone CopZ
MKKLFFAIALAAVCGTASAKSKTDTLVVTTTPQMHCANCENKIKNNLRFEKGIKDILTSVNDQTVTIVYNPAKTDKQKIESAFPKFGYKARELKKGEKVQRDESEQCDNM